MIELTAEDWRSIHCATKAVSDPFTTPEGISAIAQANYRAGMAAMAERAAQVCENHPSQMANLTYAAAIRALVKP